MAAPVPCSLGDILEAARLVLVADGVFTNAQTFLTLDPDDVMLAPPASPICGITFTAFNQRDDSISSESDEIVDEVPTMDGELVCSAWIRIALDKDGRDDYLLRANVADNKVQGASVLIRKIVKSLSNEVLFNSEGSQIVWRSLNFLGVRNRGKWRKDKNWRRIDVRFNLTFNMDLTGIVPAGNASYFVEPYWDGTLFPKPMFV